jgi:hypothetical protein
VVERPLKSDRSGVSPHRSQRTRIRYPLVYQIGASTRRRALPRIGLAAYASTQINSPSQHQVFDATRIPRDMNRLRSFV